MVAKMFRPDRLLCVQVQVFERCEGLARVKFGCVCKLWNKVRQALAVHTLNEPHELKPALEVWGNNLLILESLAQIVAAATQPLSNFCAMQDDKVKPYDTIVLPPGVYKQRALCSKPVKLISQASWQSQDRNQQCKAIGSCITSDSVIFWQERAPAVLVNADAVCLQHLTFKVEAAAHEYSCVAYGPVGRAITMKQCTVLGSTGLRVPFSLDPLSQLLLRMEGCTIQVAFYVLLTALWLNLP
jgi:hypothetical protein